MKTQASTLTIGIDLGDRKHAICVLEETGEPIKESTITNTRESLATLSDTYPGAQMVMEVGMQSPWISRFFSERGHEVIVANARKLRAIYQNPRKSDRKDAEMLAKLARADVSLLGPIQHGTAEAQRDLIQIKMRDNLVRQRVDIISCVRFILKSMGIRTKSPKTSYFSKHIRVQFRSEQPEILELIEPSLLVLDTLTEQIKSLDRSIALLARESYPETEFLRQIVGVGVLTSMTFVLTIGDPERFKRNRDIGAYLGLVPKRDQSGESDKQLRISKAGNAYLRKLLVTAAQYALGPYGPDCDLKRHGLLFLLVRSLKGTNCQKKSGEVVDINRLPAASRNFYDHSTFNLTGGDRSR